VVDEEETEEEAVAKSCKFICRVRDCASAALRAQLAVNRLLRLSGEEMYSI